MTRRSAEALGRAAELTLAALRPGVEADWTVPAGPLRWDCRRTAVHLADCLIAYAAQLAARPSDHFVGYTLKAQRGARPTELLELIEAGAGILQASVATAAADVRAWHPYGTSDPEGFAAMGVTETLVHGADIAEGLGLPFEPPQDLCRAALDRLFPDAGADDDAWALLRWATGRCELPGRPRRRSWRWHGEPQDAPRARRRIDEIARFTPQPRAVAEFYATLLDRSMPASGEDAFVFDVHGVHLFVHHGDGSDPDPGWPPNTDHVAFRVDDLDAECARLRGTGLSVEGPSAFPWGRMAWLHDPDGRMVEIHGADISYG